MELVDVAALKWRTAETLTSSLAAISHLVRNRMDVAFVFNAANAPLLPLTRVARIPVALHVDGIEWRRSKWGRWGRIYYRQAERWGVILADALIADAAAIGDYYAARYGATAVQIPYGIPRNVEVDLHRIEQFGLAPCGYHLVVARLEPENHVLEAVLARAQSEARLPLVVVGDAPYSAPYKRAIAAAASQDVRLLGSVYDSRLLDALYAGAATYVHGHSVGGTNPSLLRAIGLGAPVLYHDNPFNREVTSGLGIAWLGVDDLSLKIEHAEQQLTELRLDAKELLARSSSRYDWDQVSAAYEELARRLARSR